MPPELPGALLREGLLLVGVVGAPMFAGLLISGLVLGILQAATQINDPAVGALPRLLIALAMTWLCGDWMMDRLGRFMASALIRMSEHPF